MDLDNITHYFRPDIAEQVRLDVVPELPSTNRTLAERARTLDTGKTHVLVADIQTAGVGRRGKQWLSKAGNISFSVLSHFDLPIGKMTGLSLVTGVTVAQVLKNLTGIQSALKWPNDVMVNDGKLAGLLIEVPRSTYNSCDIVTGIGINYVAFRGDEQVGQRAISICDLGGGHVTRSELIGHLVSDLIANYAIYETQGLSAFMQQWNELDYLHGKDVTVLLGEKQIYGVAKGLSGSGELLVKIDGKLQSFNSGDVSVRKL